MRPILIVILFRIFLTPTAGYGQNNLMGTYKILDGVPLDKYIFKKDNSFSYYRVDCTGSYSGDGKYSIRNDSLILSFEKNESNKTNLKIDYTKSTDSIPELFLKVYIKSSPIDTPILKKDNLLVELLDSSKIRVGIFYVENKSGAYKISGKKLKKAAYIRFGDFDDREEIRIPYSNNNTLTITIVKVKHFSNQIISDEIRNVGKIDFLSPYEFILNRWGYNVSYKKQDEYRITAPIPRQQGFIVK